MTPASTTALARLAADFHDRHRTTYGHASPDEPVQLVNLRVSAVGRLHGLPLGHGTGAPPPGGGAPTSRRAYFAESGLVDCDVLSREALAPGAERPGPLIVEATDTTIVVPPGWRLRADAGGFIVLEATDRA